MKTTSLRGPCPHNHYDQHWTGSPETLEGVFCSGGEFLAEDALVPIAWCSEHNAPKFKGYPWCQRAADAGRREQIPSCRMVEALVILDALAVREGEG